MEEDEYSILNIPKDKNNSELEWKSYQTTENPQNTEYSKISKINIQVPQENNISYKRYTESSKNIFQKNKQGSFYVDEVDISDIKEENKSLKNTISPKIKNILKERLSNVLTPRANIKRFDNPQSPVKSTNEVNSTINQSNLENLKRKLEDEIDKANKREKTFDCDLNKELNNKLESESKLKEDILKLETIIRLQRFEIEMLTTRKLPKNESHELISLCRNNLENIKKDMKNQEKELRDEINIEKRKNLSLLKEINLLKSTIHNMLNKK